MKESEGIKEEYKGYIILATGMLDLFAKRVKIDSGDTLGFYTIKEWYKSSGAEKFKGHIKRN